MFGAVKRAQESLVLANQNLKRAKEISAKLSEPLVASQVEALGERLSGRLVHHTSKGAVGYFWFDETAFGQPDTTRNAVKTIVVVEGAVDLEVGGQAERRIAKGESATINGVAHSLKATQIGTHGYFVLTDLD